MVNRDEHYRKFGPLRDEATDLAILSCINILRVEQGLPLLTHQDFLDLAENHLSLLEPYDWMKKV